MTESTPNNGFSFDTGDREVDSLLENRIGPIYDQLPSVHPEEARDLLLTELGVATFMIDDEATLDPIEDLVREVHGENTSFSDAEISETSDHPNQTAAGVELSHELNADRVLTSNQNLKLQREIKELMSVPEPQRQKELEEKRHRKTDAISINDLTTVSLHHSGSNLFMSVKTQHEDTDPRLTTAGVLGCENHTTGQRQSSDLSSLGDLGEMEADLEADLIEIGILMTEGPDPHIEPGSELPDFVGNPNLFSYGRRCMSHTCFAGHSSFLLQIQSPLELRSCI